MDEPTAGLDPNQIRQFRNNIQRLGRTKTVLISTHILHEADAIADRVLLVNNGQLVFDGTINELQEDGSLEQPFYRLTGGGVVQSEVDSESSDGVADGVAGRCRQITIPAKFTRWPSRICKTISALGSP